MINKLPIEETEKEEKAKKPLDPHIKVMVLQAVVTAVILTVCLIIKLFFGSAFSSLKNTYDENLDVDTNINTVIGNDGTGGPMEAVAVGGVAIEAFFTPVEGELTSKFGIRTDPFTGKTAFHSGVDIAAPLKSKISAALGGRVIKTDYAADYGNYIILDHGGFSTLYAHCSSVSVKVGEVVKPGDKIALVGSTGRSTGPHLHFEIRVGENKIDPLPLLNLSENK